MSCMSTTLANPCSCFRQRAPWWDCDLSAVRWVSEEIVRPSPRLLSLALALWRTPRVGVPRGRTVALGVQRNYKQNLFFTGAPAVGRFSETRCEDLSVWIIINSLLVVRR